MAYKIKKQKKRRYRRTTYDKVKFFKIFVPILIVIVVLGGAFLIFRENDEMIKSLFYIENKKSVETLAEMGFTSDEKSKLLTLVNLQNPIPKDYKYDLSSYKNVKMEKMIVEPLSQMIKDAKKDDITLNLKSGYISYEDQEVLYQNEVNRQASENGFSPVRSKAEAEKIVPPGGKSDFQTGLSVEFDFAGNKSKDEILNLDEYKWLNKNCVDYGFIVRYPKSKEDETSMTFSGSIFRFVGVDNAKKMRALDLCLEEYCDYINLQKDS